MYVTGTLWDMSDPLPSDLPVLASQLPSNKKSYLAFLKDVKVCSAHYEHFYLRPLILTLLWLRLVVKSVS